MANIILTEITMWDASPHGITGGPCFSAGLPQDSPALEYINGCPGAVGASPYAAMLNLKEKYPWTNAAGEKADIVFVGEVAEKILLDFFTCDACGKDEREDELRGVSHYFECPANNNQGE